ncbi:hypothetical protein [Streptomyces sp. NPDC090994]|uniref:hypothetical protein n=1 Tax=Streptomyces sp. NPDC090994 TaxID=3365969 RepID=UPI00381530F5
MTTGSSTPRPNEYAIATSVDLPSAETTSGTGTHPVSPPDAAPGQQQPDGPYADGAYAGPSYADDAPYLDGPLPDEPRADEEPASEEPRGAGGPRQPGEPTGPGERTGSGEAGEAGEPMGAGEPARRRHDPAAYGDPVGDLVRAAVADRPLEEVVSLITMLERSPQYAQATLDALRAVGVSRSVEDVTRLVGLLTRPPRHADSADEAIRAAAEHRPVEEVTRLMALLHRTPLEPHCGKEAVRAAATGRPVEELVHLIGRLAEERPDPLGQPGERPPRDPDDEEPGGSGTPGAGSRHGGLGAALTGVGRRGRERAWSARRIRAAGTRRETPDGAAERAARRPVSGTASLTNWLAVVVLAGCGVAYFPLHTGGASARVYAAAFALSALCLLLALVMSVRPLVPVLAAAVVGPAALAAVRLYAMTAAETRLDRLMDLTLAPAWPAVTIAVAASLTALTALCIRVASLLPGSRWAAGPAAGARGATD